MFYWSKMYIEGFKEGQAYTSLTRCITINLVSQGFNLNSEVHSCYSLLEWQTHKLLTDLMEIHFLNLLAAQSFDIQKEPIEKRQKLINWLRFIAANDKEERAMIAMTSPILQMLNEKIDVLSLSPEERKLYESRMKLKSDIATISEVQFKAGAEWGIHEGIEQGKSLGLAEGEARGSRQKALETARILKQQGDSIQKIVQATGLSQEEVAAIN